MSVMQHMPTAMYATGAWTLAFLFALVPTNWRTRHHAFLAPRETDSIADASLNDEFSYVRWPTDCHDTTRVVRDLFRFLQFVLSRDTGHFPACMNVSFLQPRLHLSAHPQLATLRN